MAAERFGPYAIESPLGRGGMGEVHRAVDVRKGRSVALKRLPADLSGDPTLEARFRREAEVAGRLTDPHVIPIHDYGRIDGRLFLDMRLVEGRDLAEVLLAGPLSPARAVSILGQIAGALDEAHDGGLVHRDVKPSNVLLAAPRRESGTEDFVYLIDFGIAAGSVPGGRLTSTNVALGTAAYMAPERFTGREEDDRRSDVYALGCVFFEMLTGRVPFGGDSVAGLLWQHVHAAPPRPSQAAPVSPAFDAVVAQALAKDPNQRFARAGHLAEGARRALHHAGPMRGVPGPTGPASPPLPTGALAAAPPAAAPPAAAAPPVAPAAAAPPAAAPVVAPPSADGPPEPAGRRRRSARGAGPPPEPVAPRRRSAVGTGVRIAGNVAALVVNAFWILIALGTLALTGGTQLAIIGAGAGVGGIAAAVVGLGARGRLRSRYTVLAWALLGVSIVIVITAAIDADT